jgi:hypothetical protein
MFMASEITGSFSGRELAISVSICIRLRPINKAIAVTSSATISGRKLYVLNEFTNMAFVVVTNQHRRNQNPCSRDWTITASV